MDLVYLICLSSPQYCIMETETLLAAPRHKELEESDRTDGGSAKIYGATKGCSKGECRGDHKGCHMIQER